MNQVELRRFNLWLVKLLLGMATNLTNSTAPVLVR